MKNESEAEDGEWVKTNDPRGLRELPPGAMTDLKITLTIKGRPQSGLIKIGKTDSQTGAMTIYTYVHRPASKGEANSFYGVVFYWKPMKINGEDVARVERAARIGEGSRNEDSK